MKIAIMSDTHDNIGAIVETFKNLEEQKIGITLHLGDIISPFVVKFIRQVYSGKVIAIFGNNDGERVFLKEVFEKHGMEISPQPKLIEISGRKIIMTHEPFYPETLVKDFNVVLFGHTHEAFCKEFESGIVLNPGELCGYLTGKKTYAILDLHLLKVEMREL